MKKRLTVFIAVILVISFVGGCSGKQERGSTNNCYLCGDSAQSMMSYYRQFDAVGVIGLNEWCVLDFGLGIENYDSEMRTVFGNNQGVTYRIETTPSRGISSATLSSELVFDDTVIQKNLCQDCLDKVMKNVENGTPFVIVDFKTLELYSVPKVNRRFFVRDYMIETKGSDLLTVNIYYLPDRNYKQQ